MIYLSLSGTCKAFSFFSVFFSHLHTACVRVYSTEYCVLSNDLITKLSSYCVPLIVTHFNTLTFTHTHTHTSHMFTPFLQTWWMWESHTIHTHTHTHSCVCIYYHMLDLITTISFPLFVFVDVQLLKGLLVQENPAAVLCVKQCHHSYIIL